MTSRKQGLSLSFVVASQAIGQLALVAALPFLTRAFTPAEYGYYQLALSIALVLQPVATLATEFAIPIQATARGIRSLTRRSLVATAVVAAILIGTAIATRSSSTTVSTSALMTGLIVIAVALTTVDNARLIRVGASIRLAWRNLLSGLFAGALQILCAAYHLPLWTLAFAMLVARILAVLVTRVSTKEIEEGTDHEDVDFGAKRTIRAVLSNLLAIAGQQVFTITSALFFGSAGSGYVGTSLRIAGAPISFVGQGITQIFQTTIAPVVRSRQANLSRSLRNQLLITGAVAGAVCIIIILCAPLITAILLTDAWAAAAQYIAILAVPLSFQLIVSPTTALFVMLARERALLGLNLARLALMVMLPVATMLAGGDLYAASVAYAVSSLVGYGAMLVSALAIARAHDARVLAA